MRSFFSSLILLGCASIVFAQPITTNTFEQKVEAAMEAEDAQNYLGAVEWYEEAYDEIRKERGNPQIKKFAGKIAELNYTLRDYNKAEKMYERILKNDEENNYADYRYGYAMTLKAQGKYDVALQEFEKFMTLSDDAQTKEKAKLEVAGIGLVKDLEQNVETSISPLGANVNSPSAEYSPRETSDGVLYYASLNRKKIIEIDGDDLDYHARIYSASRDDKGKFEKAEALNGLVNREDYHNTHLSISPDGRTMYFTRVQTVGTEITMSKIMVSYKRDEGWSAANEIKGVNGDWQSKHPSVGQLYGRNVLFFVSDMDGGEGGFDIYYSNILGDGEFSPPVNLGKKINTKRDDIGPFYYDGTLYYSSNGLPGIGGYDIFYSIWDGGEWSSPENIGYGYNSSYDDLYMSFTSEGNRGYFVSNRPTDDKKRLRSKTCCDDIFEFRIREIVIDLIATVVDENQVPLTGATITVENITDPINYPSDTKYNSLGHEFQFLLDSDFKYTALISREGYYPDTIEFNTAGILDNYTVNKKVSLKPMPKVEEPEDEMELVSINEPIRLNNIYYDFDDDKILPDAEQDLTLLYDLMNQYPDMVIELSSHTDSQGDRPYNRKLSQRRADSAKRWLTKKGIADKRIKPVGYGEKVILNHCKDKVKCTDDEHRFNRRTEFKIIAGPTTIEIKRPAKKTN